MPAGRLGLPGDDVEGLKDGFTLLVRLRPAPVVGRVAAVTAFVRADAFGHFRRVDEPIGYPAADLPFRRELRAFSAACWTLARDLYRTRTPARP